MSHDDKRDGKKKKSKEPLSPKLASEAVKAERKAAKAVVEKRAIAMETERKRVSETEKAVEEMLMEEAKELRRQERLKRHMETGPTTEASAMVVETLEVETLEQEMIGDATTVHEVPEIEALDEVEVEVAEFCATTGSEIDVEEAVVEVDEKQGDAVLAELAMAEELRPWSSIGHSTGHSIGHWRDKERQLEFESVAAVRNAMREATMAEFEAQSAVADVGEGFSAEAERHSRRERKDGVSLAIWEAEEAMRECEREMTDCQWGAEEG